MSDEWRGVSEWELLEHTPAVFEERQAKDLQDMELESVYGEWEINGANEVEEISETKEAKRKCGWREAYSIGGDAVDHSRPKLTYFTLFVTYFYSTTYSARSHICSKDFATRRKQRGRAHWGPRKCREARGRGKEVYRRPLKVERKRRI
jgi:hypothetical protein